MMNEKVQKLVDEKVRMLRSKGFDDIEMLNRNTFKARKHREDYKIKLTDDFFLTLNGMSWGLMK
ncbi:MAG: hypothetical protein ACI35R_10915 [Bacillus sp. (in: firmicutes)]